MSQPKLATARSGWGGRGYYIPDRFFEDEAGKKQRLILPSVTTILRQVAKPGLHAWIADQTAAYAVTHLPELMQRTEDVGWNYLRFVWSRKADLDDPLRRHHEHVRDDAADLGTNIHEWIEADIDGLMPYPAIFADETEEMIGAFLEWKLTHEIRINNSEFTIVNDDIGYAGTADADWDILCLHDDPCLGQQPGQWVRVLVDLKSSRYTWRENGMQLWALANGNAVMREVAEGEEGACKHEATVGGKKVRSWWVEDDMPTFDRYALLHIRPSDLDTKGEKIEAFCKLKDRTEDMDLYGTGFRGAYMLAQSEYQLKARDKARIKKTEDLFDE